MSARFAVIYSRDYAKRYPDSETAECVAEGADLHWLCVDTTDGRVLGTDGGAPEDALLVRDWKWVTRELNAINAERDDAREKLRALVAAMDAQVNAALAGESREAADAAFSQALAAARGAL